MLKIAIFGASGRMGKEIIAQICHGSKLKLIAAVEDSTNATLGLDAGLNAGVQDLGVRITDYINYDYSDTDVVIDFSTPYSILERIEAAVAKNCGVVIGTTGLQDRDLDSIKELSTRGGRIVLAPNMSVGVNLLFFLVKQAAKLLGKDFDAEIVEMHHRHKKDSPSGTAEKLGQIVAEAKGLTYKNDACFGRVGIIGERKANEIGIHSLRGGDVVGDHTVVFAAAGERLELTHKASSRATFAKGALQAALYIANAEQGLYDMEDVLGLK